MVIEHLHINRTYTYDSWGGYCMCNLDQGFYFIQIKKGGDALYEQCISLHMGHCQ